MNLPTESISFDHYLIYILIQVNIFNHRCVRYKVSTSYSWYALLCFCRKFGLLLVKQNKLSYMDDFIGVKKVELILLVKIIINAHLY